MHWMAWVISLVLLSGVTLAEVNIRLPQPDWSSIPVAASNHAFEDGLHPYLDAAYGISAFDWPDDKDQPDDADQGAVLGRFLRVGGGYSWHSILSVGAAAWLWMGDDDDPDDESMNPVYQQHGVAFSWDVRAMLPVGSGSGPWLGYGNICLRTRAVRLEAVHRVSGCTPMWQAGLTLSAGSQGYPVALNLEYGRADIDDVQSYVISAGLRGMF